MARTGKRTYTPEERAKGLALANEIGPSAAGRQLGIPGGTISCWQTQSRKKNAEASEAVSTAPTLPKGDVDPEKISVEAASFVLGEKQKVQKRVAKVYTPSERARALEYVDKFGATKASRMLGISRFSLYDWKRKVTLAASRRLLDSAGKLLESPVTGSDEDPRILRDRKILGVWEKHPGLGPSQIKNQLRRNGFKVSVHTVRCVLEENGYVSPKVRRTNVHDKTYEALRPNRLWHLDFFSWYIHKQHIFVLLLVDDYSRFIPGYFISDAERVGVVMQTFECAVNRYGKPEAAMSDGGSAFYAWRGIGKFTRLLDELEVDQIVVDVPQKNGKLEILNANVQKEVFKQEIFFNLEQTERRLHSWISFYNFRRTHHALGGLLVPADRYFGRVDEVLAQIEAGRTPDGVGEPIPVSERLLDLLRVSTHNGQVTVTLMGKQIWPSLN